LVLHEHRKKFGTPYNQLNGKKALVHLILMKHHWMPKQINEMKFDELLLSIQDELTLDKISVTAQKFLDYRDWRSQIHHFDDFDENEWDPNLSAQYLK
ncbi:ECs1072 family phage-associated protein, partial [Escherichia coli]